MRGSDRFDHLPACPLQTHLCQAVTSKPLRRQIDALDAKIVELLNQARRRRDRQAQAGEQAPIYAPDREKGGAGKGPQAEQRAAAGSVPGGGLSRADERVVRAGEAAADRLPRPGGHFLARGGGAEVRQQRRVRAAGRHPRRCSRKSCAGTSTTAWCRWRTSIGGGDRRYARRVPAQLGAGSAPRC